MALDGNKRNACARPFIINSHQAVNKKFKELLFFTHCGKMNENVQLLSKFSCNEMPFNRNTKNGSETKIKKLT